MIRIRKLCKALFLLLGFTLFLNTEIGYTQTDADGYFTSQRELVKKVNKTVVQIIVDEFGRPSSFEQNGNVVFTRNVKNGSGVVVSDDGYIITNRHVVHGAESVQVVLPQRSAEELNDESILSPTGNI